MSNFKALVLEDNDDFAKFLTHIFKGIGFEVDHAKSHRELNLLLASHDYDLVTIDWAVEGDKDGIYCIGEIKKWDVYAERTETPLLVLSGIDSQHGRKHALKHGAHGYLTKGEVTPDEIESAIKEIMLKVNPHRMPKQLKNIS